MRTIALVADVIRFQFTRPRGARLIHGSTKMESKVSIHAPAWGATRYAMGEPLYVVFQFTRPRGARLLRAGVGLLCYKVSIHAPAWGATAPLCVVAQPAGFNSRARVGRDFKGVNART